MLFRNAKQEAQLLLFSFSEAFSIPSFTLFSSFIVGFIQLEKEACIPSMVQSLAYSFLPRSRSSYIHFLGKNRWAREEILGIALCQFFRTLRIKSRSLLFLILDDTIIEKTGKKIAVFTWYKDHFQNLANFFGHQWVLSALFYKPARLPLGVHVPHPQRTHGCGRLQT